MPEITPSNHWHREDRVKSCIRCGGEKPLSEFYAYAYTTRQGKRSTRYESLCKLCAKSKSKARHRANRDELNRRHREWCAANKERLATYSAERRKDPHHKALKAKAQRMRKARIKANTSENTEAIHQVYAEAMRIEAEVADCPVFDIPELGKKMHVDHIIPISKGGKHTARNLQVLPAGINMRKGVSCPR